MLKRFLIGALLSLAAFAAHADIISVTDPIDGTVKFKNKQTGDYVSNFLTSDDNTLTILGLPNSFTLDLLLSDNNVNAHGATFILKLDDVVVDPTSVSADKRNWSWVDIFFSKNQDHVLSMYIDPVENSGSSLAWLSGATFIIDEDPSDPSAVDVPEPATLGLLGLGLLGLAALRRRKA